MISCRKRFAGFVGLGVFAGLLLFCALPVQAGAAQAETVHAATLAYRDFTLDNGLRVVLLQEKRAPVVVVQVWYRVGSADEVAGQTGLAHMLEHMMFQGTRTLAPEEFSSIIARHGGVDNASTSQDYTNYYIKLGSEHLDLALRMEADRMRNLVLKEEKFISENKVVQEERRMRTDAVPAARMVEKYRAMAYQVHPYGRPIIGWMADIRKHSVAAMQAFYQKYYAPDNATLVVGGDLEFAAAEERIRHHFASLPGTGQRSRSPLTQEPTPSAQKQLYVLDPEARIPVWMVGFLTPTFADIQAESDAFALEVAGTILGGGLSSRLYRRLVTEEKLAVSVSADYASLSRDPVLFMIQVTPRKDASLIRLEEIVRTEVERLGQEPVPERELAKTRNSIIAEHVYDQDSIHSLTWNIGRAITSGVDWKKMLIDYPDRIRTVTAEAVQKAVVRYLKPDRWIVGVLLPLPTPTPRKVQE
ncbi:MAG: insulinase family protein [Magnetococcus sp. DMHC-1]|nr:insulinase family protein [Magnetococcales bacterium]